MLRGVFSVVLVLLTNRGYDCDLQIRDEAQEDGAGQSKRNIIEVLNIPISMLSKTTTIYLATPGTETCWLSRAMKAPHPDNPALPLLPTLRAYQPCAICAQKNKAQVCPHVINMRSKIKNTRRENALRALISDKQTFVAEVYGLHVDRNRKCFSSEAIEQLRTKPRATVTEPPRFIIICVDTAEGGSDEFAIVAWTMGASGMWTILYIDSFVLTNASRALQNEHLHSVVRWFNTNTVYSSAGLVWAVENQNGSRGTELAMTLGAVPNSVHMAEFGRDKRLGVPKSAQSTIRMGTLFRILLSEDRLAIADNMGTYTADGCYDADASEQKIAELCEQLNQVEIDDVGRWTGKKSGRRDDMSVAAQMGPFWGNWFHSDDKYQDFRMKMSYCRTRGTPEQLKKRGR